MANILSSKFLDKCELIFAREVDHEKALAKQLERTPPSLVWMTKSTVWLTRSRFMAWLHPANQLRITEPYPLRLYRTTVRHNLIAFFSLQFGMILFVTITPITIFLYEHPVLIVNGKWRWVIKAVVRHLWSETAGPGIVYTYAAATVFLFLMCLPRFVFWNRRWERLQQTGASSQEADTASPETQVWPPPPTNSSGSQSI
ncbi:MAG: hypothetical protein JWQ02_4609 [Capsulimonas sp.]|nr:hypothetical protein [Capsulimonas sp.]